MGKKTKKASTPKAKAAKTVKAEGGTGTAKKAAELLGCEKVYMADSGKVNDLCGLFSATQGVQVYDMNDKKVAVRIREDLYTSEESLSK